MTTLDRLRDVISEGFVQRITWAGAGMGVGLAGGILLCAGACDRDAPRGLVAPPDTVEADVAVWEARVQAATAAVAEREGMIARLRDRVAGMERREPVRVVEYRDRYLPAPPDTTTAALSIDAQGRLTMDQIVRRGQGRYSPLTVVDIDVRDCDDGLVMAGSAVVCNRARFGHLDVVVGPIFAAAPIGPTIGVNSVGGYGGIDWSPSFRSGHGVRVRAVAGTNAPPAIEIEGRIAIWRVF